MWMHIQSDKKEFKGVVTLIANTAKDKVSTDAITEFEVRILMLPTSYQDLGQGWQQVSIPTWNDGKR